MALGKVDSTEDLTNIRGLGHYQPPSQQGATPCPKKAFLLLPPPEVPTRAKPSPLLLVLFVTDISLEPLFFKQDLAHMGSITGYSILLTSVRRKWAHFKDEGTEAQLIKM